MTQSYPKRLIEVDLPIKRISAHARREKSIRHGHISTLHIWWARRPLAACRAVICASLWPDPADPLCPQSFRDGAAELIFRFAMAAASNKELGGSCDHETWIKWQTMAKHGALDSHNEAHLNLLRFALLDFIADFANWDNSTVKEYLETSRALTQAAHEALGGEPGTRPLVVDPFAGGGSIPLEALRVGADVYASDLNPIPVLLNKVLLEYIPKHGQQLADEVRKWGEWIKREAEKELAKFYPKDSDGATPIAYLWARTIRCEGPGCGTEVPLIKTLWLAKRSAGAVALLLVPNRRTSSIEFQIIEKTANGWSVPGGRGGTLSGLSFDGTIKRGSVTCPCCGYTTPVPRVREQLKTRRGGANDARLLCVVTARAGEQGRKYRLPADRDLTAVREAESFLRKQVNSQSGALSQVPDELICLNEIRRISLPLYGMTHWGDLFSSRQALVLSTVARLIRGMKTTEDRCPSKVTKTLLAMALDRLADSLSTSVTWTPGGEFQGHTFTRQALAFVSDFAEVNPWCDSSGNWMGAVEWVSKVCEANSTVHNSGQIARASATSHPLPNDSVAACITDPPYYDAVPYAHLSDFFYVWMRRSIGDLYPELFADSQVEKLREIVVDRPHELSNSTHDIAYYERELTKAFAECCRVVHPGGVCTIVFASKTTASWEAMLKAVVDGGWTISGSWPIDTEREARMAALGQARLTSSVHLVCRPRNKHDGALVGEWRDVLQELPKRIHEWMPRLAAEGVVGADAIFACLGPALEIFSRYSQVDKANGDVVTLKEYLEQVWAAVAKAALTQVFQGADATGFEPDARLTAMWLWTLATPTTDGQDAETEGAEEEEDAEGTKKKPKLKGFKLEFDAARKIAQGLGAVLEQMPHLVEVKGDEARLLPVSERTGHLFGKDQEEPARPTRRKAAAQMDMFAQLTGAEDAEIVWQEKTVQRVGETTLDRVHQAMILFAAGRGEALRRFVVDDGVGSDGKFWRLAQALAALYPTGSDERRWVEGVMARKRQFGF